VLTTGEKYDRNTRKKKQGTDREKERKRERERREVILN